MNPTAGPPAENRQLGIAVHRFERQRDPERILDADGKTLIDTGKFIEHDYVVYGPPHLKGRQETRARVDRLLSAPRPDVHSNNVKAFIDWDRAELVRPRYEAWLAGIEIDDGKTHISTATFLSSDEAAIFIENGVKSIEDLAEAHPMLLNRIRLPNIGHKQRLAQNFLKAKDTNATADLIREQGMKLEAMSREMEALKAARGAPEADEPDVDENGDRIPKRRGRPPKAALEASEAT